MFSLAALQPPSHDHNGVEGVGTTPPMHLVFIQLTVALAVTTTAALPISASQETTVTFLSEPISVNTSGIAFVNIPVPVPQGPIAVRSLTADLVDASNASVPLSVAYFHHWFISVTRNASASIEVMPNSNSARLTDLRQEVAHYGAGSEIRHAPETLPAGTATYFEAYRSLQPLLGP